MAQHAAGTGSRAPRRIPGGNGTTALLQNGNSSSLGLAVPGSGELISFQFGFVGPAEGVSGAFFGFQILNLGRFTQNLWPPNVFAADASGLVALNPAYVKLNGFVIPYLEILANSDPSELAAVLGGATPTPSTTYSFLTPQAQGSFATDSSGNLVGALNYTVAAGLGWAEMLVANGLYIQPIPAYPSEITVRVRWSFVADFEVG